MILDYLIPYIGIGIIVAIITDISIRELKTSEPGGDIIVGNVLLNDDFSISFEQKAPEVLHCPRCKQGIIVKGKSAWGCTEFRNGCQLRVPFICMGKQLTDSQMEQLIFKGTTNKIIGFTWSDGSKKDGKLLFDKEFRIILG
jgi:DNA topoisomerase-3